MPLHMARATAAAGKRRKTAGNKVKAYLPGRGTANYAFLVCLLQARYFRPPSRDACTPGGVIGCPTWLLELRLLECRLQVCGLPPSASDTLLFSCVWRKMHVAVSRGERGSPVPAYLHQHRCLANQLCEQQRTRFVSLWQAKLAGVETLTKDELIDRAEASGLASKPIRGWFPKGMSSSMSHGRLHWLRPD